MVDVGQLPVGGDDLLYRSVILQAQDLQRPLHPLLHRRRLVSPAALLLRLLRAKGPGEAGRGLQAGDLQANAAVAWKRDLHQPLEDHRHAWGRPMAVEALPVRRRGNSTTSASCGTSSF